MSAVWLLEPAAAVAEKLAELEAAGTKTVVGTVTPAELLERLTVAPPVGAALDNVTEHAAVDPGVKVAGEQEMDVTNVLALRKTENVAELPL